MSNMPELKNGVVAVKQRLFSGESFRDKKRKSDQSI